jgi:hypothetical protein
MHTQASQIYREQRITSHTVQFRATMMVMCHLNKRYGSDRVKRHSERAVVAIRRMEVCYNN